MIAIEHALSYRVPTALAIPYDVARLEVGEIPATDGPRPRPAPSRSDAFTRGAIEALARDLATAERPLLLAGRGAWLAGAGAALGELARATGALTATTALARGVLPPDVPDLGITGGFGAEAAMDLVREADVIVVLGASLNQFTTSFGHLFSPASRIVQVDIAPAATHPHVGGYIRADAREVAEDLTAAVRTLGSAPSSWPQEVDLPALRARDTADELAPDGRLDPRAAAIRIGELLSEDRVVVSDGGHVIGWANMHWPVASPDRMIMAGTAYQSIGLGFPSVPGAIAAKPASTVVLTTGDGGGLMALSDLESAVRTARGHGIAVVWNDNAYSAEVTLYGRLALAEGPMLIPEVDFAGLAESFGAEGVVVRSLADLERLRTWAEEPADERPFLLLDLRISGTVVAPYQEEILAINR